MAAAKLAKELKLLDVYAVATGATLSAGLFILPGLAAVDVGPAIVLCYLLAAIPLVPAMLCVIELATAMPRAGGAYYFIDRSLGPMFGTVGGLGTWLALLLKTSFALVGLGIYARLLVPALPEGAVTPIAVAAALGLGALNAAGAKKTGALQIVLVAGLLAILAAFCGVGSLHIEPSHFEGFFDAGAESILATTGAVYISYVGVTKVASISEEVKDPERVLPRAIVLSLLTAVVVYGVATAVIVGVIPPSALPGDERAPATAAFNVLGRPGEIAVAIGAVLAFASVGNAGVMSASRYPLAMSRDDLLPERFQRVGKSGTPLLAILVTVAMMVLVVVALDPLKIAKLASAFQLLMFALLCAAVMVWRESGIESYDPGFRVPWYPWTPLFGILAPMVLVAQMGALPTMFSAGLAAVGFVWYFTWAKSRVARRGALLHVFARLGEDRHQALETELREILKEKGLRAQDPFDEVVLEALVVDVEEVRDFDELIGLASDCLSDVLPAKRATFVKGFTDGTLTGATPVAKGVALPHMRLDGIDRPRLVLARVRRDIRIETGDVFGAPHHHDRVHAVFFLVSPEDDPGRHLRMLAQLARRIDDDDFLRSWLSADNEVRLREVFLRDERHLSVVLEPGTGAEELIGKELREVRLPEGSLVALVRRQGETLVPRGTTRLEQDDRLLLIGEPDSIQELRARFV